MLVRRNFLIGLASSLTAPAIVHAGNLMPIKPIMVRGIWWDLKANYFYHCGQMTNTDLMPLQHFLDHEKLPLEANWGILN